MATANTMAQSAVTGSFETMYSGYIRPALISLVFIVFVVTGIFKFSDFRKGGEYAKKSFFSCVRMSLYTAFVLAVAESINLIIL
jgi:hypothetical protein